MFTYSQSWLCLAHGPGGRQENKEADVGHLYGPGLLCCSLASVCSWALPNYP